MQDICTSVLASTGTIQFQYFVYEMDLRKLEQPFLSYTYYLFLIARGEGELRLGEERHRLEPGTLVLLRPWQQYEIVETAGELTYLYVTFYGDGADPLLHRLGATGPVTVYPSHGHLLDFWMKSIRRVHKGNALFVTESVFAHALSYLAEQDEPSEDHTLVAIKKYLSENLSSPGLSLGSVASIFFYSEKYFSHLFRERTGSKFTDYLNRLRIHHALHLIDEGVGSVGELSTACGFSNACYFSRVFKKEMGRAPISYVRAHAARQKESKEDTL